MQVEFPQALYEISEDRDNRVLILTGTGDSFMTDIDRESLGDLTKPAVWDQAKSLPGGQLLMSPTPLNQKLSSSLKDQ